MSVVKANNTMLKVISIGPKLPYAAVAACWMYTAPAASSVMGTPEHRPRKAVALQTSIVSMKTDSICTKPCFTGWLT